MTGCEKYPGREPGEWVWDLRLICTDPACEYHHGLDTPTNGGTTNE